MRKNLKAVVGLCVLLGVFFIGSSAPSGAQEDDCGGYLNPCPAECVFDASIPAQVTAGGKVTISGTSTEVDSIEFSIGGQVIGSVTPGDDGSFSATFDVPSLSPGTYTATATASSPCGEFSDDVEIEVLARAVNNPGTNNVGGSSNGGSNTPLARTGFDAAPMVTLGAAALVLGGAAVYGSKRRRTA
jgi:LPXTG-motif cell wall-anchored protein